MSEETSADRPGDAGWNDPQWDAFGTPERPAGAGPGLPSHPQTSPDSPDSQLVPGPLGVWQTLGTALSLYGRDLIPVWLGVAVVLVPIAIISYLVRDASIPAGATVVNARLLLEPGTSGSGYTGASLLVELLYLLGTLLATGAVYRILLGRYLNHPAGLGTSVGFASQRLGKLLGVTILTLVVTAVGFILIIIPGIYIYIGLSVAVPVAMAENLGVFETLGRSRRLVRDLWWHCFGVVLLQIIVVAVLESVIGGVITRGIVHGSHSVQTLLLTGTIVQVIFAVLATPFSAAVFTVLYVDLLGRKRDPHLPALLA